MIVNHRTLDTLLMQAEMEASQMLEDFDLIFADKRATLSDDTLGMEGDYGEDNWRAESEAGLRNPQGGQLAVDLEEEVR